MQAAIDLAPFRNAIGHDAEIERRLLSLFIETCDGAFARMGQAPDDATWKAETHLLKGAALNIGAEHLAELATSAPPPLQTQQRLMQMRQHYEELRHYLLSVING